MAAFVFRKPLFTAHYDVLLTYSVQCFWDDDMPKFQTIIISQSLILTRNCFSPWLQDMYINDILYFLLVFKQSFCISFGLSFLREVESNVYFDNAGGTRDRTANRQQALSKLNCQD